MALVVNISLFIVPEGHLGNDYPRSFCSKEKPVHKVDGGWPSRWLYGVSESGWMDASVFLSWFQNLFLRAVCHLIKTAPVLLSLGGHNSHQFQSDQECP